MVILLLVAVIGCEKDDAGDAAAMTARELVERGWDKFEAVDYSSALDDFRAAYDLDDQFSDAYNGAGWSAGRMDNMLDEAEDYFQTCWEMDSTKYDALGGWIFVVYQQSEWSASIEKAAVLLNDKSGWRFLHEPSLDFRDIHLVTTAAHYNLGHYTEAYEIIVSYLNSSFEVDVESAAGQRELLEEIERLRQIYG